MYCEEVFQKLYQQMPEDTAFCPYRICPLGAHIDHQLGKVTGFAIDRGIHVAYKKREDGVVRLASVNFPEGIQFDLHAIEEHKVGDWADYLRGAAKYLGEKHPLRTGFDGVIEGTLPIGGLSSSAAVTISFLSVLCRVNQIQLSDLDVISIAKRAENEYVGVSSGKLDQSCEVYCRKDHLLYLDTADDSYERISASGAMKPYKIAIFFSGVERTLAGSGYNLRVDECKSAAYDLMAFSGMEYGKYADAVLRQVPAEVFEQYKDRLPENFRKRAEHFYGESARVEAGVKAWREGDIETFGQLVSQSGYSSIHLYESGSDELRTMYEIMNRTKGIYGGRFSGAGFKGCCMALIDPDYEEEVLHQVTREYLSAFPKMEGKYSAYICESADGVVMK